MKISTTRLKQIINEELFYREFHREGQKLQEAEKAKDERISRKIAYLVDKEGKPRDQAVAIAHSMEGRGELEEGAEPIHKIVSRDGKKKGVKVSGNWKDPQIKVKWLDAEGKFGKTVSVDTKNYTRKNW